ncbi:hypothetical protein P9F83_02095 [Peribacillus psychrosaccharolyticus]|nr:hypothetical protein [Peribacillus psychrosaccharolyticus]MEC2054042.1 hypothetical protein [Peribacillus psychrosaccharolyticus]
MDKMSIYDKGSEHASVAVRKPKVKTPEVGLSPQTKKLMAQNEQIIHKQKRTVFSRLKAIF